MTAHAATRQVRSTRPVRRQRVWATLLAMAAGSLVSVGLGVYGRTHEPTFYAINLAGFSSGTAAKAWLATGVFVLVVVQLASALVLYGRVPGVTGPRWIGGLHRWSGRAAVLVSVPVAVHCLYALGLQHDSAPGAGALAGGLLFLRGVHRQDARAARRGPTVGASGARRRRVHRGHHAVAHLGGLVLHHLRAHHLIPGGFDPR